MTPLLIALVLATAPVAPRPIAEIGAQFVSETGAPIVACSQTAERTICYGLDAQGALIAGTYAGGVFTPYGTVATAGAPRRRRRRRALARASSSSARTYSPASTGRLSRTGSFHCAPGSGSPACPERATTSSPSTWPPTSGRRWSSKSSPTMSPSTRPAAATGPRSDRWSERAGPASQGQVSSSFTTEKMTLRSAVTVAPGATFCEHTIQLESISCIRPSPVASSDDE